MVTTSTSLRRCLFCAVPLTKSNASREDTVPKWLQAELGIATEIVEPTLTSPAGVQLSQRVHPVDQLRTGGICRTCNNGWMSQLESTVQPILRALIRSKRMLASLRKVERQNLSRWAIKTAFVLDAGGLEPRVPQEQLQGLYQGAPRVPKYLYVFARQQIQTRSWYYIESACWTHAPINDVAALKVETSSYKIALQFGDLILIVVHWPLSNWSVRVEKGELTNLWPPTAVVKQYVHPAPMESATSDAACQRYVTSISVAPNRGAEGLYRETGL